MDPSALIFVALAVAWGAYLIPKALEHHDAASRARTVSTFSERMRILARREAISRRATQLVMGRRAAKQTGRPVQEIVDEVLADAVTFSPMEETQSGRLHLPTQAPRVRRPATAAQRRRRVLGTLTFLTAATAATALGHVISWAWISVPLAFVAAWLVACRLMVRGAQASARARTQMRRPSRRDNDSVAGGSLPVDAPPATEVVVTLLDDDTQDIPVVPAEGTWEPVSAPLPTYVTKSTAARKVTTIDLDSTGVWTSGRTDADAAIAREADAYRAASQQAAPERRASGA